MRVETLSCLHFRNLERLQLAFSSRTIVLQGNNGQGKTNLLEAIYLCATGRSFRHAAPVELIAWHKDRAQIEATFNRQGVRHRVAVSLNEGRRTLRLDDRHLAQTSTLLQWVNVVAFFPDDLRLAKGGPEERRRFLDRAVANFQPRFVEAATAYQRVLRSRNALLRQEGRIDPALLATFDEQLISHGRAIQHGREEALSLLAPLAREQFAQVIPEIGPLTLQLTTGLGEAEKDDYSRMFEQALRRSSGRDRHRGSTSVGPHRADLLLHFAGHPAREFASQGQQRVMVLALKLAEVLSLRQQLGVVPILLLDDVSSELDSERARRLFAALLELGSQVWLTTTGTAPLPLDDQAQVLRVEAGRVC